MIAGGRWCFATEKLHVTSAPWKGQLVLIDAVLFCVRGNRKGVNSIDCTDRGQPMGRVIYNGIYEAPRRSVRRLKGDACDTYGKSNVCGVSFYLSLPK